jgi:multiple sugar transport system ATP-binding protein
MTMAGTIDLKLTEVERRFGDVQAVKSMNLEVRRGEFVVLVGPSGCGKSTLLRMIAGLEEPDEGSVEIGGVDVTFEAPKDRNIAMVFQNYALYPYMRVSENMAFPLRMRNVAPAEIERKVLETARILGIDKLLDRYPRQLSGGQRQRVAMGRALVRQAKLFLFDEPLSNLDAQLRDEMRTEIKRLHQELGLTIIYVTHDQIEAMSLADRVVLMRDGAIEQIGSPLDVYERPATRFVARFIGSPPINLAPVIIGEAGSSLAFADGSRLDVADPVARRWRAVQGQSFLLGVRPEHFSVDRIETRDGARSSLEVMVDLLEPTGARAYASFLFGGQRWMAEVPAGRGIVAGSALMLTVDLGRSVLIAPESDQVWSDGGRFDGG